MTIGDFFSKITDRAKALGDEAFDKVKGLRSSAQVAAPYETGGAAEAKWGAQGSPEAQAYKAGTPAAPAAEAPAGGGLRAGMGKALRIGAGVGAAADEGMALANNVGAEGPMRAVGRSALRGGATVLGAVGGGTLGSFAGPVGTVAGGVGGALAGREAGDWAANKVFGMEPTSAPKAIAPAAAAPQLGGTVMEGRSSMTEGDSLNGRKLPTAAGPGSGLRTVPVSPAEVMSGAANPTPGYGAFQRTTPGNPGQPTALGGPESLAQNAAQEAANNALRRPATAGVAPRQPGVFGEIAQGASLRAAHVSAQAKDAQANKNIEHGLTNQGQQISEANNKASLAFQQRQLDHTMGNENEKRVDERTAAYARGKVGAQGTIETGGAFDNRVKQKAADIGELVKYSVADRKDGKTVGTLSPTEHNQLMMANDIRERVTDARGGFVQGMRDFFGNKQFDSKNLYSYMPVKAEAGAIDGGYVIHFANGNTANVKEVAGGKFNILSSNTPVDADVMAVIKPLIDKARKAK